MTDKPKLRVFISADMEGASGIVHTSQTGRDQPAFGEGRARITADVNAAIEGVRDAGPAEIVVADGHGDMRNIKHEELHAPVSLVRGAPRLAGQLQGLDSSFDAALFVGYHARKGTGGAILDHSIKTRIFDRIAINDRELGECGLNAAVAGHHGVPVVFISGDSAIAEEARDLIPEIVAVEVKRAASRTAATCIHPQEARDLIKLGATRAVVSRASIAPFTISPPFEVTLVFTNTVMADAVELMPGTERAGGRTIALRSADLLEASAAIKASMLIASAVSR